MGDIDYKKLAPKEPDSAFSQWWKRQTEDPNSREALARSGNRPIPKMDSTKAAEMSKVFKK